MQPRCIPVRPSPRGNAVALAIACFLAACDGPLTGSPDGNPPASATDSLDAELGKDKLNQYDFAQGKSLPTGKLLDLAIEGRGFFILKNPARNVYFRRPANFSLDAEGYLNLGNVQIRLQGIPLASDKDPYPRVDPGAFPAATGGVSNLADIKLPFNDTAPPRATAVVKLAGNLDSEAAGKGSILYSRPFLHAAVAADRLVGLMSASGEGLGIEAGDVLTLSAAAGGSPASAQVAIGPGSTLGDLSAAIEGFLRGPDVDAGTATIAEVVSPPDGGPFLGAICLYGNSRPIRNFQVTSNRPISGPRVTRTFAVPTDIPGGTIRLQVATGSLRRAATAADLLSELSDAQGNDLGLETGDQLSFSGSIGGAPATNTPGLSYMPGPAGTKMGDILQKVKENFQLPDRDGSSENLLSVAMNPAGSDDDIPDGSIVIRGQAETASAIRDVSIRATDANNAKPSPNFFNTNVDMTTLRDASDSQIRKSSLDVFDESGKPHPLAITFIPTSIPGHWLWEADLGGAEKMLTGGRGELRFGSDGSLDSFLTDAKNARLEFDPGNGLHTVSLTISAGGPGEFTGLTQFRLESTAALVAQDGFSAGRMKSLDIGEDGIIMGTYTNGMSRALFQIPLADFPNPRGLAQIGGNSFLETAGSGKPMVAWGLGTGNSLLRSGALEYVTAGELARICAENADCQPGN
jgi:flagellar hook protein FlgE